MTDADLTQLDLAVAKALGKTVRCDDGGNPHTKHEWRGWILFRPTRHIVEAMEIAAERGYGIAFRNAAGYVAITRDGWIASTTYAEFGGRSTARVLCSDLQSGARGGGAWIG